MGEVVEGCGGGSPPPCNNAVCWCAGGGFVGSAGPLIEKTCRGFPEDCEKEDLCNQCYGEAGCSGSNKRKGKKSKKSTMTTCGRRRGRGPVKCTKGNKSNKRG